MRSEYAANLLLASTVRNTTLAVGRSRRVQKVTFWRLIFFWV